MVITVYSSPRDSLINRANFLLSIIGVVHFYTSCPIVRKSGIKFAWVSIDPIVLQRPRMIRTEVRVSGTRSE